MAHAPKIAHLVLTATLDTGETTMTIYQRDPTTGTLRAAPQPNPGAPFALGECADAEQLADTINELRHIVSPVHHHVAVISWGSYRTIFAAHYWRPNLSSPFIRASLDATEDARDVLINLSTALNLR